MTDELEIGPCQKMAYVLFPSREKIVQAQDIVPLLDQAIAEVRPEETGTSGN